MKRVALALAALTVLPGCESTADKSARLQAQAGTITTQRGLDVAKVNTAVRVLGSSTLSDANGSAVVVTLRDMSRRAMAAVPIAIDVRSAAGKTVFRNNTPGAEPGLVSVPLLLPGKRVEWVHDQVQATGGRPARVVVRVGGATGRVPRRLPRLTVGPLKLTVDPASGTEGSGRVTNDSQVAQRRLTIYAIARRGSKVVAAGRAVVNRVAPGHSATFSVFFIGNPAGARIAVTAPPSVLS